MVVNKKPRAATKMCSLCYYSVRSDCEEAHEQGILQHVDGFQYPFIRPRSSNAPFKACCYVHNNASKLSILCFCSCTKSVETRVATCMSYAVGGLAYISDSALAFIDEVRLLFVEHG